LFRYPTLNLLICAGVALLVSQCLPIESDLLSLAVKGGTVTLVYGGLLFLFERHEYSRALRIVSESIRLRGSSSR
jgi:hypothetical protein